jgi:alkylated DNA repair protein (DNA oxidative demethylase)
MRAERFDDGAALLRGFCLAQEVALHAAIQIITAAAPFRHMVTPGGHAMSAAMTNCGAFGWITDRRGYRYAATDPQTGKPWPPLPDLFITLAQTAATAAGYEKFCPDACLINRYEPGAKMALHQDRDEQDFTAPIVSVSLGLPAIFLWGGKSRADKPQRLPLASGDVLVWGGPSRLTFHGIAPVKSSTHAMFGSQRINLTFRKAS